ncbi:hypothetical protein [Acinetobacter sp. YH12144]|uniref:hypothetical protein n=1 Tax=Acinetobacter sp. YH12144 TaxID=2601128 RepID=UPI0015D36036|nr:hypothetical protein [Acinetobacter sp. YH12144]
MSFYIEPIQLAFHLKKRSKAKEVNKETTKLRWGSIYLINDTVDKNAANLLCMLRNEGFVDETEQS